MTTIEALFDLYEALGGDADEISTLETIPEVLEEISEVAGSTIELPGVTASDNGDVLTVVDGKWAKAEAPTPTSKSTNLQIVGSWSVSAGEFVLKQYGNVCTLVFNKSTGSIVSGNVQITTNLSSNIKNAILAKKDIPLYQSGAIVGYFSFTSGSPIFMLRVSETLNPTSEAPVTAEYTFIL